VNNELNNIWNKWIPKVHDRDVLEPKTIIITLIGTALKVLEE
jgi:hypothetical protein